MRGFSSLQGSSLVIYIFLESHLVHGDRRFVFYKVAPRSLLEFLRIPPRLRGACGLSRQHGLTFSVFFPCLPVLPGFCLLRTVFCSVWGPLLPGAEPSLSAAGCAAGSQTLTSPGRGALGWPGKQAARAGSEASNRGGPTSSCHDLRQQTWTRPGTTVSCSECVITLTNGWISL